MRKWCPLSWMDNDDTFMKDHEVFVSLGLRAEDEATSSSAEVGLNENEAEILVDDHADNEPRFAIDKENSKIRKGNLPINGGFQNGFKKIWYHT